MLLRSMRATRVSLSAVSAVGRTEAPRQELEVLDGHGSLTYAPPLWTDQASWGAAPSQPDSVPKCLRHSNSRKPLLWIVNGGHLHSACTSQSYGPKNNISGALAEQALAHFNATHLARDTVVVQPAGATGIDAMLFNVRCDVRGQLRRQAADEQTWLQGQKRGMLHIDFGTIARRFATLMSDSSHFAKYNVPCAETFPEMAILVAQLILQVALQRAPTRMCT